MATTRTGLPGRRDRSASSGSSSRQGAHQLAQNVSTTGPLRYTWAKSKVPPPSSGPVNCATVVAAAGGRVEVHDVQPREAGGGPSAGDGHGIVESDRLGVVVPSDELHAVPVAEVDGGNGEHQRSGRVGVCRTGVVATPCRR